MQDNHRHDENQERHGMTADPPGHSAQEPQHVDHDDGDEPESEE